jgi:hypothetical protein
MLTWEQQEQNWINLEPQIKQYFNNLATSDPNRTGQAFFEDTIPENIQSYPQAVTDILNGNDALNIADKDWSHDISDHNGGSGAVENGTFEDLGLNRARQEVNMTGDELEIADTQLQVEADILETFYELPTAAVESVEVVAEETALELAADALGATGEFISNALPPVLLAYKVGSAVSDDPEEQLTAATLVGSLATIGMFTPAAPLIAIGSIAWTACTFFGKFANN